MTHKERAKNFIIAGWVEDNHEHDWETVEDALIEQFQDVADEARLSQTTEGLSDSTKSVIWLVLQNQKLTEEKAELTRQRDEALKAAVDNRDLKVFVDNCISIIEEFLDEDNPSPDNTDHDAEQVLRDWEEWTHKPERKDQYTKTEKDEG